MIDILVLCYIDKDCHYKLFPLVLFIWNILYAVIIVPEDQYWEFFVEQHISPCSLLNKHL